ncbi:MAG: ribonuclease HI family protein [Candidatus Niyogibacteria bacterium]|nr:ribonuclease HI family protein [Candidatus Niyogibacteria bacterium]
MSKYYSEKIIIYTDGGSRGNPGPAAIGVVIQDEKERTIKKYGEAVGHRTNNEAEYEAVIFALKKVKQLFGGEKVKKMQIEFRMDSELVTKQLNNEYKIEEEKLIPLFIKIHNLRMDFGETVFKYIQRGKNKEADRLLNEALDEGGQKKLL